MKITFISRLMAIKRGGGENFDIHIARELQKRGHRIEFLVGRRLRKVDVPLDEFRTVYIKSPYLRGYSYRLQRFSNKIPNYLGHLFSKYDLEMFYSQVIKHLKRTNFSSDIFQICSMVKLGALIEETFNKPAVIWWPGPASSKSKKYADKCSATFAHGDAYRVIKQSVDPSVYHVPVGVDQERFVKCSKDRKLAARERYGFQPNDIIFLFVGRLIPIKNLHFSIRGFNAAFKARRHAKLVLVGEGEERWRLKYLVQRNQLSDQVIFVGPKYGTELVDLYNLSDVFVITSTYENCPNVVLEAMSCGLPVIATRVGGIRGQISPGQGGILVENDNLEDLTCALLTLGDDTKLRKEYGEYNYEIIRKGFGWKRSAEMLEKVYSEVVDTGS